MAIKAANDGRNAKVCNHCSKVKMKRRKKRNITDESIVLQYAKILILLFGCWEGMLRSLSNF